MATAKTRRPPATRAKITVTVPRDVLEAAQERIRSKHVPSLSAYISEALAKQVAQDSGEDEYRAWLKQLDEELGPPSDEDYEWARNVLRR